MDYLKATPQGVFAGDKKIILRGMGLGNWLLPEGYMWKFYTKCDRPRRIEALIETLCGQEYALNFWDEFYSKYITKDDITWIRKQGLNSVRLPLNARHLFYLDTDLHLHFNEKTLNYIDQCLLWCKENEIYLILDMHAAPGGQTGTNIDDSQHDMPELFANPIYQDILEEAWCLLAQRYASEPTIGGYDLINEPLPNTQKQYNAQVAPLYHRLINAIRKIDSNHMIILEGVHWASDFSIFEEFTKEELKDNVLLQFHKYWNNPDEESLVVFLESASRLEVPLWMGEGGENNLYWYTTAFPMYERAGIGWCFWSYKKMDTKNSPVNVDIPKNWDKLLSYLEGNALLTKEEARAIFDDYLDKISHATYQESVINALLRKAPVSIPAFAFDKEQIVSRRNNSVSFRTTQKAPLLFADGHSGEPNWKRYGGEDQPESEHLIISMQQGDMLGYHVTNFDSITPIYKGDGEILVTQDSDSFIWIQCTKGTVQLQGINIE
ncbi:MAG: glycoside hydrolase family 5 protein [Pseudobutyrivibrio sp.]|nr:glycoside hydrolase family 5 protein [Pseudobutyrivibrio sp.]